MLKQKYIAGVKVNMPITMGDSLKEIENLLSLNTCNIVSTTNAEFIMDAQLNASFKNTINTAALSLPDGVGVLFAGEYIDRVALIPKNKTFCIRAFFTGLGVGITSLLKKHTMGEKVSGVDLTYELANLSNLKGYSLFLLGGWPKDSFGRSLETSIDIATLAGEKLKVMYPNINIIGATSKFSYKKDNDVETTAYIKECMAKHSLNSLDLILVAYNHVEALGWLDRNGSKIPVKVGVGVGGTFDYVSGYVKRAPKIVVRANLEWLYRLITQPWRIARISKAFPKFPLFIFNSSLKNK